MKRIPLVLSLLALVISLTAFYFSSKSNELVYVDVNKLIEGYKRTQTENAIFEKKALAMKAKVDTVIAAWQKEVAAYERERGTISDTELKLKQQILSNRQQEINSFQENLRKEILSEEKKMKQTVINDINDYLKEFGAKKGYEIIFGAGGNGNIMYANETSDLTEEVLKGLNAEYGK